MIEQLDIFGAIAQAEAEAWAQPVGSETVSEPTPETSDKWQGFQIGDQVIYTARIPRKDTVEERSLAGVIVGFAEKFASPTALVRVGPQGPGYPCWVQALRKGGDRNV